MPHSIQCPSCEATLNLPDQAIGRKLKCPKCGVKFQVGAAAPRKTPANPLRGVQERSGESTLVLTKSPSDFDIPFEEEPVSTRKSPAASGNHQGEADALALFDNRPAAPRRKSAGDARANARRCPTCGGVVPPGMSLCQNCGLDLETGMRVSLVDDLTPPPPPRPQGIPAPVAVVGFFCLGVSTLCTLVALLKWLGGAPGAVYFLPIAGFGVYASIHFLRCKSARFLLMALTLGAMIDLVGFIALPLWNAIDDDGAPIVTSVVKPTDPDASESPTTSASTDENLRPITERLDTNQLTLGIALLLAYGVVSIYTLSISVNRHMRR